MRRVVRGAVLLYCCAAALRETLLRNLGGLPTV
jgi:hypothetical protein